MKSENSLKLLIMTMIGLFIAIPATQADPSDATLDKLKGKKQDQFQNELDRGSEQGQFARQNRQKWWIFLEAMEEEPPTDNPDPTDPPTEEPDPTDPPIEEPDPTVPPIIL
ncbi:hypothetical protein [Tichowtungia aerotolerans]|uniref:Uncharacterized protein n=1 Tax=Tichowtungia aerotolerans TaxID=2697043 RepID=A0A6P1M9L0_9BACT|nr:hypothetical protein [Tichowtungia aerotolerans]QHI69254.1 hypothetical protein GT409_07250 [Tichowtungia aerotolerans]